MKEIKSIQSNLDNKQPSNLEAEQALLGSILVNNDVLDEVSNKALSDFNKSYNKLDKYWDSGLSSLINNKLIIQR